MTLSTTALADETPLVTAAWKGAVCGLLAGIPVVLLEAMHLELDVVQLASHWERAELLLVVSTFVLWPAAGLGAVGGVAKWSLSRWPGRRIGQWWLHGRGLLLVLVGLVAVAATLLQFPAFRDTSDAYIVALGGVWLSLWAILAWASDRVVRRPLRQSVAGPARRLVGVAAGTLMVSLVWSGHFVFFNWEQTPRLRSIALHDMPLTGEVGRKLQDLLDFDSDGHSPFLGGGDCRDGDPLISPAAREVAGNGVDEDCDGHDLPLSTVFEAARRGVWRGVAVGGDAGRAVAASAPVLKPRSIILITVDTLRPDVLGLYGAAPSPSPHLDALARGAVVFERAYAQAPLTKASVSSMMVGRYFTELRRSRHRFTRIHEENDMLAERLGRAGYATSAVTSHAYLSRRSGYAQGFDSFNCVARRGAPWVDDVAVDHAIDEVERLSRGRAPFFFWLHLIDPHHPYEPHKSITAAGPSPALSLGSSRRERYLAEVAWTDGQLGRFFGALDEAKILDNVVLGIHSDHGESFGEHGLKYHGQAPYEEQIRAVLILRAPEVEPGRRASPVMLMDLHPTLVGLAEGAPLSATSAPPLGRPMSLWPTLFSAKPSTDRPIFAERHAEEGRVHRIVMVSGRHKLMHSPKYDTWSLFDLERDPGEINDRFSVDEARARRMKGVMRRFLSEMSLREAD